MHSTLQIRKPIDALTQEDLDAFMVWDYAQEEVQARGEGTIPRDAASLAVAADFVTADGSAFAGVVALSTIEGIALQGASLIADGACIQAAQGDKTPLRYKTRTASELGKAPAHIYPLRFTLRAKLEGEAAARSGIFD